MNVKMNKLMRFSLLVLSTTAKVITLVPESKILQVMNLLETKDLRS